MDAAFKAHPSQYQKEKVLRRAGRRRPEREAMLMFREGLRCKEKVGWMLTLDVGP